jgi:hypothetical protein
LFNIVGRIAWASFSDVIGRKATYGVLPAGHCAVCIGPAAGAAGSVALFAIFCVILTMMAASRPSRRIWRICSARSTWGNPRPLLTAWSVAGILGPVVVNYIREYQLMHGVPAYQAYNTTLYILAALLLGGLICNLLVRPVADRYFMTDEELAAERRKAHETAVAAPPAVAPGAAVAGQPAPTANLRVVIAWLAVGIPLAWGVWTTLTKALPLFGIR